MTIKNITLIVCSFFSFYVVSGTVDFFSDSPRTFKALLADPREAQLRVGYLHSGENKSYLDLGMGGQLNMANIILDNGHLLTIAGKGLMTSRFQYGSKSFDQQNSDFISGLSVVFGKNSSFTDLYISHQSSHYGDDIMAANSALFKNYSFETIRMLFSQEFSFPLRVYGGFKLFCRSDPEELLLKTNMIIGGEFFPSQLEDFYVATHVIFKQENSWAPDTALLAGYLLGDRTKVQRRQRIFLEVFNGYSPMGQLSQQREFTVFLGFGFSI